MTRQPLDYVGPGDPIPLDRGTWNGLIDAGRYVRAHRPFGGAAPAINNPLTPVTRMFVKNATGIPLERYSAVYLVQPLVDPLLDPSELNRAPATEARRFTSPYQPFGVLLEPLAADQTSLVYVATAGVTLVKLLSHQEGHPFARPTTSGPILESGPSGPCRIIWRSPQGSQSAGEPLLGLVQFVWGQVNLDFKVYKPVCEPPEEEGGDSILWVYEQSIAVPDGIKGEWVRSYPAGCCTCTQGAGSGPSGTETGSFPADPTLPLTVPGGDCVVVPVTVSGMDPSATLAGVRVRITHPDAGQLTLTLTSPTGEKITLLAEVTGNRGPHDVTGLALLLSDRAATNIQEADPRAGVLTGVFSPKDPLAGLTGSPNGTYFLKVCAGTDPGTVDEVGLCFGSEADPAFTIDGLGLADDDGPAPFSAVIDPTFTGGTPAAVAVDWGDGSPVEQYDPDEFPRGHTYTKNGLYEIAVAAYPDCGASASATAVVAVGLAGGTLGGCAAGAVLTVTPSTTCMSGALNANTYTVVRDGAGHWRFDAGGAVGGGGIQTIDLYDAAAGAEMRIEGNCADGTSWSVTLTQGSITCSPLDINLAGTTAGGATCACSTVGFNAEVAE